MSAKNIVVILVLMLVTGLGRIPVFATDETAPVAAITADGCTSQVYLDRFAVPSLRIFLSPEQETGTQADWWLVAKTSEGWFNFYYGDGWFPTDRQNLEPAYQGPLFKLPGFRISDMDLPGLDFSGGTATFYFGVDTIQNGELDLDALSFGRVTVIFTDMALPDACSGLAAADTWMYQIQDLDTGNATAILDATDYPLLVVEPGHNFSDFSYDTPAMVSSLAKGPAGGKRTLLAYIDVGQAEDYRDYWGADWVAPTEAERGSPDFLITIDPDNWSGNFVVAYWYQDWKDIWLGPNGLIAEIAAFGFDGVYLDWVEAYDDDAVRAVAGEEGINTEIEMIRFIEEIGAAGRAVNKDFLVISQNAPYLIDAAPDRYVRAIDALAVEDTWFHGDGDVPWNHPRAGDLHERHDGIWSTPNRLAEYERYKKRGLTVFSVDYCRSLENAAFVYEEARKEDLVPLVTRVPLSRLTETPPEMFP